MKDKIHKFVLTNEAVYKIVGIILSITGLAYYLSRIFF